MEFDKDFLSKLLKQAEENPRLRQNFDLRNGDGDTSQRMLNALQPGTHVPIHRHTTTSETVILLRGHVTELFYNEKGVECGRHELNPAKGVYGVQVPVGMWHTLVVHEPSVIIEMKDGAYVPITMDDIWQYE
ncbi:WbuC family cupin fold metalloprotein [Bacteroides acidifaciens]|uniref:WbuC family cupin fold metalloprotein n=1 Tax=Bacteroides acidifaciens TaxID=85831 RepID=UPI003014FB7A